MLMCSGNIFGQTQSDTLQIKEAVLNYLEGLEYNDTLRVEKALHPDLAKRVIDKDKAGNDKLENMTAESLLYYTKTFDYTKLYKADVNPQDSLVVTVMVYDISHNIATVKATQNKFAFFDYIHLGKINGEWKIINILWAWTE
jgi:hypothetical protein